MQELQGHPGAAWGFSTGRGPYAPNDLAQEKRVRSRKLLDAAVGVAAYFERAQEALKQQLQALAARGPVGLPQSPGSAGSGRLNPYLPLHMQGDSYKGYEALLVAAGLGPGAVCIDGGPMPGVGAGGMLLHGGALSGREVSDLRRALGAMGYDVNTWLQEAGLV